MKSLVALLVCFAAGLANAQEKSSVTTHVRVAGEVRHELVLSVDDLRAIARRRKGEVVRDGFAGLRLVDLLEEADIRRDARNALRRSYVVAFSSDGYQAVFSWGELFNSPIGHGVLVAYERDGEPLRDGEGRIALVSLGDDRIGPRHVKWLSRIEVKRVPE